MIVSIALTLFADRGDGGFKVRDALLAPEPKLESLLGRRISAKREAGIRFARPGFHDLWVNNAGGGMTIMRLGMDRLTGWKECLSAIGLDGSHAKTKLLPVAQSPIPLFRNKMSIEGVGGLPAASGGKGWKVTYVEYAVANKERLHDMRPQIMDLPPGDQRNRLIRSCYDWWSELELNR